MSVTQSNKPQTRYTGQLAQLSREEIAALPSEGIAHYANALQDRMEQAYAMKTDLVELAYIWAEEHGYTHLFNPEETWYIGPKSPATKPSQNISKTGWTMLTAVGNKRNFTTIRKAIEDMNTLGRRTTTRKRGKQPLKEGINRTKDKFDLI